MPVQRWGTFGQVRVRGIARAGTVQAAETATNWHQVAKHFLFKPRVRAAKVDV